MNTFGIIYRLTSFGESHGPAIGGVIAGMPAGIEVDMDFIQSELARRRPGQSDLTTSRKEMDEVEILSGVFEGKTTGTPIGFIVRNTNQHSSDYEDLRNVFRPSHADYTYHMKYGIRDHRGGGRSSARITISRVVAGAFAKLALKQIGVDIAARITQVGDIVGESLTPEMENLIREVKAQGDTIGGVITCNIKGCPVGIGEPEFGKLHQQLASAMMSINAAHGFDYGAGFVGLHQKGSEQNDIMTPEGFKTNNSGGIQGGISNGEDIYFRVAFKPIATQLREQDTVDVDNNPTTLKVKGRHDPCVLPRAVPIVEAMAAITILDCYLLSKTTRI